MKLTPEQLSAFKHALYNNTADETADPVVLAFEHVFPDTKPEVYTIGDLTMAKVFKPAGLTDVHDLQAVFDAAERAFLYGAATPAPETHLRASVYALRSVLALTATADAQNPLSSKKHEPCNSADLDCDPADVHSAQDKGYRIGTHSGSCAEPCAADIYERPDEEPLPQPRRKDGGEPCGECYIQTGETCDICGAVNPSPAPREGGRCLTHQTPDPKTRSNLAAHARFSIMAGAGAIWAARRTRMVSRYLSTRLVARSTPPAFRSPPLASIEFRDEIHHHQTR